ncbi:MAG: ArsR family transcriptional regulator [Kiloniellaceae bacterium]
MSDYARHLREHLRLTLLRLLGNGGGGYAANESVLCDAVNRFGFNASRDAVRVEIVWLAEQDLLSVEDVEGVLVATLTKRGLDVAEGRARVPGVKRPGPPS